MGTHTCCTEHLVSLGLTTSQAIYVTNIVSNAIRKCGDRWCCDNFRFSINGNHDKKYEDIRSSGCCGFYDSEVVLNDGTIVKFGFNYGH